MSRTLSGGTTTEIAKAVTAPRSIIKVEWGGGIGTKYYGDHDFTAGGSSVEGKVIDWGIFKTQLLEDGSAEHAGDVGFVLADPDLTIMDYLRDVEFHTIKATFYQWFSGLGAGDFTPLIIGKLNQPISWIEEKAAIEFNVTDIATWHADFLGQIANIDDFANIWGQHEDSVIPIVYGYLKRAPTVCIAHGAETTLAVCVDADKTVFAVQDGSEFPQDTTITVKVDNEEMRGVMHGNKFTVSTRGFVLLTSTTSANTGGSNNLQDSSVADFSPYIHKLIKVDVRGTGDYQWNVITGYNNTKHRLYVWFPWMDPGTGLVTSVIAGADYMIAGKIEFHEAGSILRQVLSDYVWIANEFESEEVISVEARGRSSGSIKWDEVLWSEHAPDVSRKLNIQETWVTLRADEYTVDLADNTTWPGHTCTTITMHILPTECPHGRYISDELYVTIKGTKMDRGGSYSANPARVIEDIITRNTSLTYAGEFNAASWTAAEAALNYLRFGFSLQDRREVMGVVSDLCFQSRSAMIYEPFSTTAKAVLKVLYNRKGASILTITKTRTAGVPAAEDGLSIGSSAISDVITRIQAQWTDKGEGKNHEVIDATAESTYGRRDHSLDLWAYSIKAYVHSVSAWWLARWNTVYEQVKLVTYLSSLEVTRGDTITLTIPGIYTNQTAFVTGIEQKPGSGEAGEIDRLTYDLRLPIYAGCASKCELSCETGCEDKCQICCQSDCETDCESFACETGCELPCQLVCVTGCELSCTELCEFICTGGKQWGCATKSEQGCQLQCEEQCEEGCETSCESGCEVVCQTNCESWCETSCETGCETACQTNCETTCETTCETECETSCTTNCETTCETTCETGCEAACQTGCQTTCETGCQTSCEVGCETTCQTGCETACQTGCEMSCETGCEAWCETGCEQACEVGCETVCEGACQTGCELGCETACMTGCEDACETTCETACQLQCETGCETTCEGSCETACQLQCETACQTGCEDSCETGCETTCELQCETGCQTGCQMSCESDCEVTCELHCETGCETGCELGCETGCETSCELQCETGCETGCEMGCETACQTSCQLMCEIDCETGCEQTCQTNCETGCQLTCEIYCETGCEEACQSTCQTDCTVSCQGDCMQSCETGCEGACETACTGGCQWGCEISCETGCEIHCEIGCQFSCTEEICEISCQIGCETTCMIECQTYCEVWCQTGCETVCETGCQTGCETGCQSECTTACQLDCELGCESNCETVCESGCQTGCESICQTGCETTCMYTCQTACQTGCELECQTGCQTSCETGCQTSCESACELACQTTCEEQCELACQTTCESACELECMSACEIECMTGCEQACQAACQLACMTGGELPE